MNGLVFRMFNSLLVIGYYSADEYWQSLEIAHKAVWYGESTWEWESSQIRSAIHPMLFAAFYKFLDITGLDWRWLVAYGPRLIMAVFVWLSDEYLYRYTEKWYGSRMAKVTWVLYLAHWYVFYAMCRTYSNSLEAIFFFIAFYYWSEERYSLCNVFIGLA